MAEDFIPTTDPDFHTFQGTFADKVTGDPGSFGHTAKDAADLTAAQTKWDTAYKAHLATQVAARTAAKTKDEARAAYEKLLRAGARKVNGMVTVSNAVRAELGMPPHVETPTTKSAPVTRPLVRVLDKGGLRQELHWVDEKTPHTKRKPAGVHACQVWLKIGDTPPVDDTGCKLVATDTASPYLHTFDPADAGKTAYWLLRWVSTRGDHGPFGQVVAAPIQR